MTTATTVNSLRGYDPTEMNFSHVPTSQQQLMPLKQPEQRWRGASSSVSHSRSTSRGRSSSRRRATGSNQNASHVEAGKEQGKENLTKTTGALKKTSLGQLSDSKFQVCRRDDMKATIHVTNESLASQLVNNFGATGHAERPVLTGVKSGQISVTMEHRTALSHTGHEAPVTIMKTVFVGVNIVLVRKLTHYLIHCLV
ncbi:uncharacterized protein [Dermacentor andersoni]|uniref:uncharacterized protein isoform X2 n=1 Tax=Dermacentor andersoni TaxID=34620 RepID=UPI0024160403|nr:uncharacterized protein LOC129381252 isoform X2 [Dermacentor andersoni]